MVSVLAPPDIAVSVRGSARVVRERMKTIEDDAIVEIDVEEVKNDMVRSVVIESTVTVSVRQEYVDLFQAALGEMGEI